MEDDDIVTGSNTVVQKVEVKKVDKKAKEDYDLNNDGKVDKKDASIAAKIMNKVKGKK